MSGLVKYEIAIAALAECKRVDEVKSWANKAAAMQAYGRMAKDKTLEVDASEIRIRAERRLGELIADQKKTVGLNRGAKISGKNADGSVVVGDDHRTTLDSAGISKDLSSRAQKLAAVPEAEFEAEVTDWRERVTAEGARVSARLEASGAKNIAATQYFGPSEEEIQEAIALDATDNVKLIEILASDDPLGEAAREIKRLKSELAVVKLARDGFMNQLSEVVGLLKTAKRKLAAVKT